MATWNTGEKNGMWNGGRTVTPQGYVLVRVGTDHHLADVRGYAYEHRLVAEEKLGRPLRPGEHVHHKNQNRADNDPGNLSVVTPPKHRFLHREPGSNLRLPGEDNPNILCACGCGESFPKFDDYGRPRQYATGHNPPESPTQDFVLEQLSDGPKTLAELVAAYGNSGAVKSACTRLIKAGLVIRVRRGVYGRATLSG